MDGAQQEWTEWNLKALKNSLFRRVYAHVRAIIGEYIIYVHSNQNIFKIKINNID